MPLDLWLETLLAVILGLIIVPFYLLRLVRHRRHRVQHLLMVMLVGAIFVGLASHSAWRLENYCSTRYPHVDCVPDNYDGPLWRVYFPLRHVYQEIRNVVAP